MIHVEKKKKPKRPYRSSIWIWFVGAGLAASLLSGCTVYEVAKKEVFPGVKQIVIGAGPHLIEAAIYDLSTLIGWPIDQAEKIVGYLGPSDTVPPTPTIPTQ